MLAPIRLIADDEAIALIMLMAMFNPHGRCRCLTVDFRENKSQAMFDRATSRLGQDPDQFIANFLPKKIRVVIPRKDNDFVPIICCEETAQGFKYIRMVPDD